MVSFDSLVMDESKKLSDGVLDIAAMVMPVLEYLRKKGLYGVWPYKCEFQMHRDQFIATFKDYTISTYPTDDGSLGRTAIAEYKGVKFSALLDMEE